MADLNDLAKPTNITPYADTWDTVKSNNLSALKMDGAVGKAGRVQGVRSITKPSVGNIAVTELDAGLTAQTIFNSEGLVSKTDASPQTMIGTLRGVSFEARGPSVYATYSSTLTSANYSRYGQADNSVLAYIGSDGGAALAGGTGTGFCIRHAVAGSGALTLTSDRGASLALGARTIGNGVTDDGVTALQVASIRANDGFNSASTICNRVVVSRDLNLIVQPGTYFYDPPNGPFINGPVLDATPWSYGTLLVSVCSVTSTQLLYEWSNSGYAGRTFMRTWYTSFGPSTAAWKQLVAQGDDATFNTISATNQPRALFTGSFFGGPSNSQQDVNIFPVAGKSRGYVFTTTGITLLSPGDYRINLCDLTLNRAASTLGSFTLIVRKNGINWFSVPFVFINTTVALSNASFLFSDLAINDVISFNFTGTSCQMYECSITKEISTS